MAIIRKLRYQHPLYLRSVVRTGSHTRACEELALFTISALWRTVEARLGELTKAGRTPLPTEVSRFFFTYADAIFGIGRDLVDALEHGIVGIDDVVPKAIALRLLAPALGLRSVVSLKTAFDLRVVVHRGRA